VLLAKQYIDNDEPLVIANADQVHSCPWLMEYVCSACTCSWFVVFGMELQWIYVCLFKWCHRWWYSHF
jgi:hypothetical protein